MLVMIGWFGLSTWGAPLCDGALGDEHVARADAVWLAMPARAGAELLVPIHSIKGEAEPEIAGRQATWVVRTGDAICLRPVLGSPEDFDASVRLLQGPAPDLTDQHLWTLAFTHQLAYGLATPPPLREAEITGVSRNTIRIADQTLRFVPSSTAPHRVHLEVRGSQNVALMAWTPVERDCRLRRSEAVSVRRGNQWELVAASSRFLSIPLSCADPERRPSACVGPWANPMVDDAHLDGVCPPGAVHVAEGGQPSCVDRRSCAHVPFVGQ